MRDFDEIREFVEREIVPRYDNFDAGHDRNHVQTVISQALSLAEYYPEVDRCMLLIAAAYHDLGLINGREHHHTDSARIIRKDSRLRQWFSDEEINTIADAAEDHRASSDHEPRSMLGRLVAEADRQIDGETIVRRAIQYSLANYPQLDRNGHYRRMAGHVREKYGEGGYLHLWVPESPNARRLEAFRNLLAEEHALRALFDRLYPVKSSAVK